MIRRFHSARSWPSSYAGRAGVVRVAGRAEEGGAAEPGGSQWVWLRFCVERFGFANSGMMMATEILESDYDRRLSSSAYKRVKPHAFGDIVRSSLERIRARLLDVE